MGLPDEAGTNLPFPFTNLDKEITLNLNEDEKNPIQDQEIPDFRTFALELVHKLSNEIIETHLVSTIAQEIVDLIILYFPITYTSIETFDENGDVTFSVSSINKNVKLEQKPRPITQIKNTLAGEVLRRKSTFILSNKHSSKFDICPSLSQQLEIKRYIGMPIIVQSEIIGVFSIASSRSVVLDKETIKIAETICHHISALFAREQLLTKNLNNLNREQELSKAMSKSQIVPFYQPEIDLRTKKVVGAEALARWIHPRLGILTPKHFLDVAEDTDLISDLFEKIFAQVLKHTLSLHELGQKLTIWTNISARQFHSRNITDIIRGMVKEFDIPMGMIGIEITETALMRDPLQAAQEFKKMKELGIKIALDDFGTGYSSLSHLANFPVDMLKIDRSFIIDIAQNKSSSEIVSAVIGLSKGLKIKTIAEGIENEMQAKAIAQLGCDYGQGYLFLKPTNFSNFVDYISTNYTKV